MQPAHENALQTFQAEEKVDRSKIKVGKVAFVDTIGDDLVDAFVDVLKMKDLLALIAFGGTCKGARRRVLPMLGGFTVRLLPLMERDALRSELHFTPPEWHAVVNADRDKFQASPYDAAHFFEGYIKLIGGWPALLKRFDARDQRREADRKDLELRTKLRDRRVERLEAMLKTTSKKPFRDFRSFRQWWDLMEGFGKTYSEDLPTYADIAWYFRLSYDTQREPQEVMIFMMTALADAERDWTHAQAVLANIAEKGFTVDLSGEELKAKTEEWCHVLNHHHLWMHELSPEGIHLHKAPPHMIELQAEDFIKHELPAQAGSKRARL